MEETWKTIPGHENYMASTLGRIMSLRKPGERIMATEVSNGRYLTCRITVAKNKQFHTGVHRLVAAAFHGRPSEGMQVNHINGVCMDNRPENLEYMTMQDNIRDKVRRGAQARGESNARSKLTEPQVLDIYSDLGNRFSLAAKYNITYSNVWCIQKGKTWRHITGAQ